MNEEPLGLKGKFGDRLKEIRLDSGKTQQEIADMLGLTKGTISKYESKTHSPQVSHVRHLAEIFSVNPIWLSGMSNDKHGQAHTAVKQIPILGAIAAGLPILAQENIEGYEHIRDNENIDFCLRVKGNSMIGARVFDGDIVFIRKQSEVENGEIAAVIIDGEEATLKRVYRAGDTVILRAENQEYKDMIFGKKDSKELKIIGKAVKFTSEVR